jgi:urease accessory protein
MSSMTNSWQGQIDLQFRLDGEKTLLRKSYAQAPLKIQRPFYPELNLCHTVILHSAGGMVGGDRLSYNINLAPASQALITTAAAAKIYRSAGDFSQQQVVINLDRDAYLEWLPQDTIIFNSALYSQNLRVNLAPGATFCAWDIVRLGRSARSESFTQGCWQNALEVWKNGQPLWIDRQQITGDQWKSLQATAGQPILGLMVWLGEPVGADLIAKIRALASQPENKSGTSFGVSAVAAGLVCRYRGDDRQAVQRWFIEIWTLLRQHSRQRSACIPRVWQL